MKSLVLHPALSRLLRYQTSAKLHRMWQRFRTPRRLILTTLGLVLGLVWLSNALLSLFFRESADPAKLQVWIPLGLTAYALWHVLKIACRTPIEPFEWTDAEREQLGGAPLSRLDLVRYRLASIVTAATFKAFFFALMMTPDLQVWVAGFAGMLLGLIFLDLTRMSFEVVAYAMTTRQFQRLRAATIVVASAAGISALVTTMCHPLPFESGYMVTIDMMLRFISELMELRVTWPAVIAQFPFFVFGQIILAPTLNWPLLSWLLMGIGMVAAMMRVVVLLDRWCLTTRGDRERKTCESSTVARRCDANADSGRRRRVVVPARRAGVATLAWRQLQGVWSQRTPVLISLIVPTFLSVMPVLVIEDGNKAITPVIGALIFYSFILLPTALKFDFRRDLERITVLKSLPISPRATTLGQLLVPITIAFGYQCLVLTVVMIARPYHPGLFCAAVVVLLPINIFIFASENVFFLMYPYRLNQEGIDIFLRTTLAFTAKGVLFGAGLALTLAWAVISSLCGKAFFGDVSTIGNIALFFGGMWIMMCLAATATMALLSRTYHRFDPSQDLPA